ncbi:hypothetical protein AMATHDRAFT_59257 [Amanita thiersii Skay4041]|uniref:DUF6533 domain-containing protein n=1 Tax=Amanita thiersii Skay4041 TaxID=703135 RepID=A0A2A9NU88_9AGAR|nr:hypothetical protein AMATHDRAFT_59257 [Amanita thiersii Skay4041]
MDENQMPNVIRTLRHAQVASYADVAAMVLLIFDISLTFSLEVKYVWQSHWSIIKVMYLIMRYVPFFTMTCVILIDVPGRSPETCSKLMDLCCYGVLIAIFAAEAILTLRLWAIYLRNRRVGVLLFVAYFGMMITIFIVVPQLLDLVKFASLSSPNGQICYIASADKKLVFFWFVWAGYDAFQCTLLAYKAYKAFKHGGRSRLVKLLYRDGILYYIFMMVMSMLCMVLALLLPVEYLRLTAEPTHIIHTALTARIVLHVRLLMAQECGDATGLSIGNHSTTTKIVFVSRPQQT